MDYLDEFLQEQQERAKMGGFITENHISGEGEEGHEEKTKPQVKIFSGLKSVPANLWDEVVDLLREGNYGEADKKAHELFSRIRGLKKFEAMNLGRSLLRKARTTESND